MKHKQNANGDDWLDDLDAIMSGDAPPPDGEEDLLHVATRLASALAPLRQNATAYRKLREEATRASWHGDRISDTTAWQAAGHGDRKGRHYDTRKRAQTVQGWIWRQTKQKKFSVWMLIAASLLLLCFTSIGGVIGGANLWRGAHQVLQNATSLDQINGVSIAALAPPHTGLRPLPLLPTALPANTRASTFGVLTDASDPNIMTTFVADYHINGQDVQLFEQPSDVAFLSTTAQTVKVGSRQGQLFQDNRGNYALQWYQNNMLCQLTSKLPATLLISLASVFQPISSWDLLR